MVDEIGYLATHNVERLDLKTVPSQPTESIVDFLALPAHDFVSRSFWMFLGRLPSPGEQRDRERALHLGCGRIHMLAEIYQSPEADRFRCDQREQGSDEDFVERLYQRYLGRSPDPEGLVHYTGRLKRKSRVAIEAILAKSEEAVSKRSLLHEIERLVVHARRERQWWRWFGGSRRKQRIQNIENEVIAAHIARRSNDAREQATKAIDAIREQVSLQIDQMRIAVQQDIMRIREKRQMQTKAMMLHSSAALEEAINALSAREEAFSSAAARREAQVRADLEQARIDIQNALMLLRDDAQARFDRLVESQRAEQAAAMHPLHKIEDSQISPHARNILRRMRTLSANGSGTHI